MHHGGFRAVTASGGIRNCLLATLAPSDLDLLAPELGREPINLSRERLAGVRYSPIATKLRSAAKRRDGPETGHSIASSALRPGLIRATPLSEGHDPSQCDVLRRFATVN